VRREVWRILVLCCLMIVILKAEATHIVGGELNYVKLSGDQYRVELKLYKDCGTSIVPFDDPALIYVYGEDNLFDFSFEIPLIERDTLEAIFQDTCLVIPPEVCVDFARYETIVELPPNQQGYTLAFIRCCRTLAIRNAEGIDEFGSPIPPDLIGTTYTARIPGGIANSNPEFKEFPPIIVCSGQDIFVDHSAVDPDGDQLVYSLCTPYVGGALTSVFGDPLVEMPPFEEIQWVEPYSLSDLLGAEPVLSVHPTTGLLTGKAPYTIGQFVVGVCVQEFRNGVLLSENKRDFQFNIADCGRLITTDYTLSGGISIDTLEAVEPPPGFEYILVCDSVPAVQFHSLVEGADSIVWNFGDGGPNITDEDPYYTFPDTGLYLVSLYGDPGQNCADTFRQFISIQFQNVEADFEFGLSECYDPATGLQFSDISVEESAIAEWQWSFSDGATSTEQNPVHFFNPEGLYGVSLEIVSTNGCRSVKDTQISIIRLDEYMLEDTVALCNGDSVLLELEIDGEHTYNWQPLQTLSDAMIQTPLAFPVTNTTYTVSITSQTPNGSTCIQEDSIRVLTDHPIPDINDLTDSIQCSQNVILNVETAADEQVIWSQQPDFSSILSEDPETTVEQLSDLVAYYVEVSNAYCSATDTIPVLQRAVIIEAEDLGVCLGMEGILALDVFSNDGNLTYTWSYPEPPYTTTEPVISFTPDMTITIDVSAENETGCAATQDILVEVFDPLELIVEADPAEVINSQTVIFNAENVDASAYSWIPPEDFDDAGSYGPSATVSETTTFYVDVTDMQGCVWRDSVLVTVIDIPCSDESIFIPNAFSPNNDGLNDVFRLQGTVIESLTLEIYDRWGNPVFRTNDINTAWDGQFEGRSLASDVFGYMLVINCFGGEDIVKKGSITLIR